MFGQGLALGLGHGRHFRVVGERLQVLQLGTGAGQGADSLGDRLQLGMLLGQADDLLTVGGRAHAGLDLLKAVNHLIETGLGKSQGKGCPAVNRARGLAQSP